MTKPPEGRCIITVRPTNKTGLTKVLPVTAEKYIEMIQKDHLYKATCALLERYKDLDGYEPVGRKSFTGGVIAIMNFSPLQPEFSRTAMATIRKPGIDNPTCAYEAMEKIKRLHHRRHYSRRMFQYFASQSADKDKNKKGGCVLGIDPNDNISEVYVSFAGAGLPDIVEEALCYGIVEKIGLNIKAHHANPLINKDDFVKLMSETVWV